MTSSGSRHHGIRLWALLACAVTAASVMLLGAAPATAAPANDNFANATLLASTSPVTISGSNVDATAEGGEDTCCFLFDTVWYRWTPPATGTYRVDLCASGYDTFLKVLQGTAVNALASVASNNDAAGCGPDGKRSRVDFNATAGQEYKFQIGSAVDNAQGTISGSITRIDTDPPETSITFGPSGLTTDSTPTFGLGSDEAGSTFQCRIDASAFAPCTSPFTTISLADGAHTLDVVATDTAGNPDATPARRSFQIDTTAPETSITKAPKAKIKTKRKRVRVSFEFTADEKATFQCSLDGEPFAACTSPSVRKARKGAHVFAVRATDAAGNADATPATTEFKVKRRKRR